ncbi:hypothetical protein [Haloarcula sp. JP-L23]|uniref:hypothetical protein n=1 Tax=Haloarcula sp. JP-L23 TaxID=2716717 RepID=UPI00140E9C61|nr:hypothetical protein G9465_14730 [Haloarcula sp. JP-L23]
MIESSSDSTADVFGLDGAVIDRTAEKAEMETDRLVGALDILHAELIGRHSNLERTTEYVTEGGVRAYRVEDSVWDDFLDEFDFESTTEAAVRYAHTEQARLLFAKSVRGDDHFGPDEEGVVVGIDTAEQF